VIHEPVLEISCGQKQCAQTDRQTDTRRWPQDLAAYGAQVNITLVHQHLLKLGCCMVGLVCADVYFCPLVQQLHRPRPSMQ